MDLTSLDLPEKLVLRALFELAQRDHPVQSDIVARVLDLEAAAVERLLERLGARGLVDAERARLTLKGLAVAVYVPALPTSALGFLPSRPSEDEAELAVAARGGLRVLYGARGSAG